MGAQGCQQAPRPAPEPPISPAGAHGVAGGAGVGWGGRPLATVPSRGSPLCVPPLAVTHFSAFRSEWTLDHAASA